MYFSAGRAAANALVCCLALTSYLVAAYPTTRSLSVSIVHQFPLSYWIENFVVRRSTGTILATTLNPLPQLYHVDPTAGTATLVHQFSGVERLLGITEGETDVYYVSAGNYSFATGGVTGSWSVFQVDLRHNCNITNPVISKLADLPDATLLNGATTLGCGSDLILLADSINGVVWSVNVKTGAVAKAIQDPTMAGGKGLGVNGLHVLDGYLFFTNTAAETLTKIPINTTDATATGPATSIAVNLPCDDFTFDGKGDAWVAANAANSLIELPDASTAAPNITAVVVVNTTALAGVTSARFSKDGARLFVSTSGGVKQYISGNLTVAGTISSVDVSY